MPQLIISNQQRSGRRTTQATSHYNHVPVPSLLSIMGFVVIVIALVRLCVQSLNVTLLLHQPPSFSADAPPHPRSSLSTMTMIVRNKNDTDTVTEKTLLVNKTLLVVEETTKTAASQRLPLSTTLTSTTATAVPLLNDEPTSSSSSSSSSSAYPGSKGTIAYAISVTSCAANATSVLDGPAILSHSIHQVSIRSNNNNNDNNKQHVSNYDYALYAFVHPHATACTSVLQRLGYTVLVRDIPFSISDIQSSKYQQRIELDGCCGSKEFLKLWAYTLYEHDIVVHTDTDVFFLKPMDSLFDAMLASNANAAFNNNNNNMKNDTGHRGMDYNISTMFRTPLPSSSSSSRIEFMFTRDYNQMSQITNNPARYGVQGGFFIVRPDKTIFAQLIATLLKGDYKVRKGWGNKYYGGYWGSPQIQGFLSYFYGEIRPKHAAIELNRCIYNTMIDGPYQRDHKTCRTGETTCEDCRDTPLTDMVSVHLTTCRKPWECPLLNPPFPERCRDVHVAWFEYRKSLELSWGYQVPTEGWWFSRTLGYCIKRAPIPRRFYVPLVLPNNNVTTTQHIEYTKKAETE